MSSSFDLDPARPAAAEVCGDHALVLSDDLGRAVGDHAAELEHDHPVADAEHEPHVVVDQQRRLARVGEGAQRETEFLALARVESGGGLVEAQQPRPAGERAGDAHELALSLRELVGHRLGGPVETDQSERPVGLSAGDGDVLADLEVVEQVGVLPRPRQAAAGSLVRRQRTDVLPVERDAPRERDEARDRVDQRRLAGAVRSDQADQLALADLEVDVLERVDAAECDGQAADREHGGGGVRV